MRSLPRDVLNQFPGSLRQLALADGVSEGLLRAIRDGRRRMTARTRNRLVAALRAWEECCGELAELLEAIELQSPEGGDDG